MSDAVHTTITCTDSSCRIAALSSQNEELGELTLRASNGRAWLANHTLVHTHARGRGVAGVMFDAMADWARAHDYTITPVCSYIAHKFEQEGAPRELLS